MRRDYFICTFLLCICVSLFYVCFSPLYFVYGSVVVREFSTTETVFAWIYAVLVFVLLPLYSSVFRKFWVTAGLACYSLLCGVLPVHFLSGMGEMMGGENSNILSVTWGLFLRAVYGMVEAPFAPLTRAFGDKFTEKLPRMILPVILIAYCGVQLYRFYRDAYIQEKLTPETAIDKTAREHHQKNDANGSAPKREPEILGTVISAPVKAAQAPVRQPEDTSKVTVSASASAPAAPKPAAQPAKPASSAQPAVQAPASPKPAAVQAPAERPAIEQDVKKVVPTLPAPDAPTVVQLPGGGIVIMNNDEPEGPKHR